MSLRALASPSLMALSVRSGRSEKWVRTSRTSIPAKAANASSRSDLVLRRRASVRSARLVTAVLRAGRNAGLVCCGWTGCCARGATWGARAWSPSLRILVVELPSSSRPPW